ncbi:MAG: hypothetical protein N3B13_03970 [Deltaproteobacteria bacterium]|nr:hypothetical protein [Deltaproteobacteria bacterium]
MLLKTETGISEMPSDVCFSVVLHKITECLSYDTNAIGMLFALLMDELKELSAVFFGPTNALW